MTSLTRYSNLFYEFLTGAEERRHDIKENSMGGAAHFRVVIIASLAGILFDFDTAVIAGVTTALREIFSLSPAGLGATVSSALWAHCSEHSSSVGPAIAAAAATRLRVAGLLHVIFALACALAGTSRHSLRRFLADSASVDLRRSHRYFPRKSHRRSQFLRA